MPGKEDVTEGSGGWSCAYANRVGRDDGPTPGIPYPRDREVELLKSIIEEERARSNRLLHEITKYRFEADTAKTRYERMKKERDEAYAAVPDSTLKQQVEEAKLHASKAEEEASDLRRRLIDAPSRLGLEAALRVSSMLASLDGIIDNLRGVRAIGKDTP